MASNKASKKAFTKLFAAFGGDLNWQKMTDHEKTVWLQLRTDPFLADTYVNRYRRGFGRRDDRLWFEQIRACGSGPSASSKR
jgi:hypothetical protein